MKFYGQWSPPVDEFLYTNYFQNERNGFFIECGAYDGITESCCKFFEESMGWKGINIEPIPYIFDKLIQNRPHSTNLMLAMSNYNGSATFTQAIHPSLGREFGNGSLSHTDKHKQSLIHQGCKFESISVQTITYEHLIVEQNVTKVDLFVLDVEGHEIQVLEGMKNCGVIPKICCIEHGHSNGLTNIMSELGYKLDKTSFNNSFFIRI
jgi:FkbM family methyltransferase